MLYYSDIDLTDLTRVCHSAIASSHEDFEEMTDTKRQRANSKGEELFLVHLKRSAGVSPFFGRMVSPLSSAVC